MQQLTEQSKQDLEFIISALTTNTFTQNGHFSEQVNDDLEEMCVIDKLRETYENGLPTKNIITIKQQREPKIKKGLSFFVSKKIKVIIQTHGDYYWMVQGQPSAVPGEIISNDIKKDAELTFSFVYKMIDKGYQLVGVTDSNGLELGTARTWPGRPDLMAQYKNK